MEHDANDFSQLRHRFDTAVTQRPPVFGAAAHHWRVLPPLGVQALRDLERRTGPLPLLYRRWVAEVSSGGAGPGYGLLHAGIDVDNEALSLSGDREWLLLSDRGGGAWSVLWLATGEVMSLTLQDDHSAAFVVEAPDFATWLATWLAQSCGV